MSQSIQILLLYGPYLPEVKLHNMLLTHLLTCFTIMGTPSSIKTDNSPTYISRQFKQFLQSFSIKYITGIPYNPQAQGIVEWAHHTLKLQIKKFKKREYTATLLSSLSRADFSRLLPGKSHGQRSLAGCSPWGHEEWDTIERLPFHFSLSCIGEGNGNPLQCSCLENPRDGGAWWAAVYGIAQSQTQLKWLSSSSSNAIYSLIL